MDKMSNHGWTVYITPNCDKCSNIIEYMNLHKIIHEIVDITSEITLDINEPPPWLFYNGKFFGGYKEFMEHVANLDNFDLIKVTSENIDTSYKPYPILLNASMMYLAKKFPDACVLYVDKQKYILKNKPFFLVWDSHENKLYVQHKMLSKFKQCLDKQPSFILVYLQIKDDIQHANFLIYDVARRQMERFEPLNPDLVKNVDHAILSYFNKKFPGLIEKYYKPIDYSPEINFQIKQELEKVTNANDPGGFCVAWSIWYADMRMTYPEIPRDRLVEMSLRKFKLHPELLTTYIRKYASFLHNYMNTLYGTQIPPIYTGVILYAKQNQNIEKITRLLDEFRVKYTYIKLPNKISKNFIKHSIGITALPSLVYDDMIIPLELFDHIISPLNSDWIMYGLYISEHIYTAPKIRSLIENNNEQVRTYLYPEFYNNFLDYLLSSYSGRDLTNVWPKIYKNGTYVGNNMFAVSGFIRRNKI